MKYELSVLRKGLNLAVKAGKLFRCPPLPEIHVENTRKGFFERADLDALVAELPDYMVNLVVFSYYTGWRSRSELIGKKDWTKELYPLMWRQVDFDAGVVRLEVGETKNSEGRTFPFSVLPPLKECLERQREYTSLWSKRLSTVIPWVFHRRGTQMRDFPYGAWAGAIQRANLQGKIPHDFRRTAARNLERAGVSRSVAMKLTGHKTEAMYRRYAIVSEADLSEGVAKLAALG